MSPPREPPDLDDPFVRGELERTETGREALRHLELSRRAGIGRAGARVERRLAQRKAAEALSERSDKPDVDTPGRRPGHST
jgi:hypothetical protein